MKAFYSDHFVLPLPAGHRFPMSKYRLLREAVEQCTDIELVEAEAASDAQILLAHEPRYVQRVLRGELTPVEQREIGFPWSPAMVERSRRSAGATIGACRAAVIDGVAANLAGGTHHAGTNWGEGFCLLNDQGVAANYLFNKKLASSILIIDLDVHQGNGTAQIFENEPRVFTFSMHAANNFPFRKETSDLDIPLPDGISGKEYLDILYDTLPKLIAQQKPDFIFFQAGVDVLATDKLGKLKLTREDCKMRDQFVFEQCLSNKIPVQVSMGGGYSPQVRDIVEAHCNTYRIANQLYF